MNLPQHIWRGLTSLALLLALATIPNPLFANQGQIDAGRAFFDQGHFAEAVAELAQVSTDSEHFPEAQSYMARSLDALGLAQLALNQYSEILSAGRDHSYFEQAFHASAALSRFLGQHETLGEAAAKLGTQNLPALERSYALYAGGLWWHENEDFEKAVQYLAAVPRDDVLFVPARLQMSKALIPLGQRPLALAILQDLMENEQSGLEQIPNGPQLAILSYARMAYGMGLFDQAADYYAQVSRSGPYWSQALLEQSWTHFALWQFQDAERSLSQSLGTLHTLTAPNFSSQYFPEAYLLEAQIFYILCKSQSGGAIIERFLEEFTPLHESLVAALKEEGNDPQALYETVRAHRAGESTNTAIPKPFLNLFVPNPTIDQIEAHVAIIQDEQLAVSRQSRAWGEALTDQYASSLSQHIEVLQMNHGKEIGARLNREATTLLETIVNTELAALNLLTQEVQLYEAASAGRVTSKKKQKRRWSLPSGARTWPFEGEYWKDELGTYIVQTSNECGTIQR